jgi:NAD+ synthase (glutamine-hydrolysing)
VNGTSYPDVKLSAFNLENVQARDRSARVLSAIASAIGAVFTNNGNKTETTVGYATLYGDVAGFMATIADLWKTQVYALGAYINERHGKEVIPTGIFTIVASAELSNDQNVDEGKGDPIVYWYHDFLYRAWVEKWDRATPTDIADHYVQGDLFKFLGIDKDEKELHVLFPTAQEFVSDLERWWKLFKGMAVAKRVQAPPVLALTRRVYGFDYRETLNGVYFSNRYLKIKEFLGVK